MLCDTGPIVALLDADDPYHQRACQAAVAMPVDGWLTTWACITEAMHLLGKLDGHRGQEKLWQQIEKGLLVIQEVESGNRTRLRHLMTQYNDAPMDLADATLVVLAERTDDRRVFTFDSHFRTYMIHDKYPFEVIS
jgi:uncharacterized protein